MNAVVLIFIGALVFAFGYRFYARFVGLFSLRLDYRYPPPSSRGEQPHAGTTGLFPAFTHHLAAVAGGSTLVGLGTGIFWGWVPAFLWIVVGSVLGAGVFGMAGLWLAMRHPGRSIPELAGTFFGDRVRRGYQLLMLVVAAILCAALVYLIAYLLSRYPALAIAFWLQIPLALGLRRVCQAENGQNWALFTGLAASQLILLPYIGQALPIQIAGGLELRLADMRLMTADSSWIWLVLLLVYGYHILRQPAARLCQPRGSVTGIMLALALLMLVIGIISQHPGLEAPSFNPAASLPGPLPWLFVTITGGAIAGFHALIAFTSTAPELSRETQVQPVGYLAALLDGLLALAVMVILATMVSEGLSWEAGHQALPAATSLPRMVDQVVHGWGRFMVPLGISETIGRLMAALVVTSLALTTLEVLWRSQQSLLEEITGAARRSLPGSARGLALATMALTAVVALVDGYGRGGWWLWPIWGGASLLLAAAILALAAWFAYQQQRTLWPILTPLVFTLVVALWALGRQLVNWMETAHWWLLASGAGLWCLGLVLTILVLRRLRTARNPGSSPEKASNESDPA
jgi:carbon starvation protein